MKLLFDFLTDKNENFIWFNFIYSFSFIIGHNMRLGYISNTYFVSWTHVFLISESGKLFVSLTELKLTYLLIV